MPNSINWGEIYKTSWWGYFIWNVRSIIITNSIPEGFTDLSFFDYKTRVLTDLGTFEGEQCAINTYNEIIYIS